MKIHGTRFVRNRVRTTAEVQMIKPEATINKLQTEKPVTIAALGDSLTQGWMVHRGYIDFLQEMLLHRYPYTSLTMVNQGIPGDTADSGLYRLRRDILAHHPDCIFVQYALNDAFMGHTTEGFRNTIERIIGEIRADGEADIVLITSVFLEDPDDYEYAKSFYGQLEELAGTYGLPVARVHAYWQRKIEEGVEQGPLVQYDQVHPTEEGHRLMAEAVMELFE